VDGIKLTKPIMQQLLTELGMRLQAIDRHAVIGIYGGAVMCMEFECRVSSFDIDCIYDNEDVIPSIAKEISLANKIQGDWLNNAIQSIVLEDMNVDAGRNMMTKREYAGITALFPSAEQMLAMKIYAARLDGSSDFEDAVALCEILQIANKMQLQSILTKYFKRESIRERNKLNSNVIGRFISRLAGHIQAKGESS